MELQVSRNVAKRMGWRPKEEWTRDPDKWVDAPEYLEATPKAFETLRERTERNANAAAAVAEDARRVAREQAQAEIRAAAEAKDPERAERAAQDLARNSGPPPQTQAWLRKNGWFDTDLDAQALAVAEINRQAGSGASIERQLEAAEEKVRQRFPEHFGEPEARRETRLSERPAPVMAEGNRVGAQAPKVKGFREIGHADRELYNRKFRQRYEGQMGLKPEEGEALYARAYWKNLGEE